MRNRKTEKQKGKKVIQLKSRVSGNDYIVWCVYMCVKYLPRHIVTPSLATKTQQEEAKEQKENFKNNERHCVNKEAEKERGRGKGREG